MTLTFYHSMVCPRCHVTKLFLSQLLPDFPGIEIDKVEFLTHKAEARANGVKSIPALMCDGKKLSGFVLTKGRIREFLTALT